jgi:hypothetical protein
LPDSVGQVPVFRTRIAVAALLAESGLTTVADVAGVTGFTGATGFADFTDFVAFIAELLCVSNWGTSYKMVEKPQCTI